MCASRHIGNVSVQWRWRSNMVSRIRTTGRVAGRGRRNRGYIDRVLREVEYSIPRRDTARKVSANAMRAWAEDESRTRTWFGEVALEVMLLLTFPLLRRGDQTREQAGLSRRRVRVRCPCVWVIVESRK